VPWYRAYLDKKIIDGLGGEHSRVVDAEASDRAEFEQSLSLEDDEMLNQIVELSGDPNQ
jgi:hypothetical protein